MRLTCVPDPPKDRRKPTGTPVCCSYSLQNLEHICNRHSLAQSCSASQLISLDYVTSGEIPEVDHVHRDGSPVHMPSWRRQTTRA